MYFSKDFVCQSKDLRLMILYYKTSITSTLLHRNIYISTLFLYYKLSFHLILLQLNQQYVANDFLLRLSNRVA